MAFDVPKKHAGQEYSSIVNCQIVNIKMGKKFAEYSKLDLSEVNGKVLKKWDENQVFAKSMTEREGCPSFVFFEGPPSA